MSPTGNLRYLTEDQLVLERRVEAAGKEVCRDATASSWRHGMRPERGPYSPERVEGNSPNSVNKKFGEFRTAPVRYLSASDAHGRDGSDPSSYLA
jgi:hypothetical protein